MTEHSGIDKGRRSPDCEMLRRSSNNEFDVDRRLSNSSGSSERRVARQVTSEARIQNNDSVDDNCIETECERLSKYPDYCRTITIRGLTTYNAIMIC